MNTFKKICQATLLLSCATTAIAEQGGGATGRTLDAQANQGTAAEVLYRTFSDANEAGVRLSHRLSEQILVYGDFVRTDIDVLGESDGFGGGLFYFFTDKPDFLPQILDGYDLAARASYHTRDGDTDNTDVEIGGDQITNASLDFSGTSISAELLLSPSAPLLANGLSWYAGVGVTRLDAELNVNSGSISIIIDGVTGDQSSTEITGSAGLVLPTSFGAAFAAVDYLDGASFAAGVRYKF